MDPVGTRNNPVCSLENWVNLADKGVPPRSVRWILQKARDESKTIWSKTHFTEGNGAFTACGRPISNIPSESIQEMSTDMMNCKHCRQKINHALLHRTDYSDEKQNWIDNREAELRLNGMKASQAKSQALIDAFNHFSNE